MANMEYNWGSKDERNKGKENISKQSEWVEQLRGKKFIGEGREKSEQLKGNKDKVERGMLMSGVDRWSIYPWHFDNIVLKTFFIFQNYIFLHNALNIWSVKAINKEYKGGLSYKGSKDKRNKGK